MANKYKEQLDEQLGLLETKVERVYDVNIKKEFEQLSQQLKEMSLNIQKILCASENNDESEILNQIIEQVNQEAEELTKNLVDLFRKQEKQEALYNVSHLYSKTADELIEQVDELKGKCIAQARRCVSDIDSIFDEVVELYSTELKELELEEFDQIIAKVNIEIMKCRNVVHELHSEYTYKIEDQIINNIDKMARNLVEIKEKNVEEKPQYRIKGGVTNSQNGSFTLSDIISSKTEVITDVPKRANTDNLWD